MPVSSSRILSLSSALPSVRTLLVLLAVTTTTLIFTTYPVLHSFLPHSFLTTYLGPEQSTQPEIDWYTTRFLDERLPVRPPPQVKKWNICACAMVHNEGAYLPEWIEFHRMQGVSHFVLYDFRSTDLMVYLPMWYEDNGVMELIDIIPAKFVPRDLRDEKHPKRDRRLNKHYAMLDCYMRHRNLTEWIVMMDVSQFLFSPRHKSTWAFVKSLQEGELQAGRDLSVIATSALTYGPSPNLSVVFDTWMTPNPHTGGVDQYYEPVVGTSNTFPLVMESNPNRANHPDLESDFQACTEGEACEHVDPIVVFVRSSRCTVDNVTDCIFNAANNKIIPLPDSVMKPSIKDLHVKNYPWRPRNLSPTHDSLPKEVVDLTKVPAWYSKVPDLLTKHVDGVRNRIMEFRPIVFRNVGRECVPEALMTGQQVKCPSSHPYPFGDLGVNFLHDCCATDKDQHGNQLAINSTGCQNDNKVHCRNLDTIKKPWLHRSCCIYTK
jgi:Glycosyltransferase family 92